MLHIFSLLRSQNWLVQSLLLVVVALLLVSIPWVPISIIGGILLLILLPGMQIVRWLGLWAGWRHISSVILSIAFGVVVIPLILFWTGWLVGLSRISIYAILILTNLAGASINHFFGPAPKNSPSNAPRIPWLVIGSTIIIALAIILVYTEPHTNAGSYPTEMGDWVKHQGVAWSLRETGLPPKNVFFAGPVPDSTITYYYFTHLNVAALDWLSHKTTNINVTFVTIAVIIALSFIFAVYMLAQQLFDPLTAKLSVLFVTLIGGGDIIPTLHRLWQKSPDASWLNLLISSTEHIDNWATPQSLRVSVFIAHYLWVPQHIAALLIVTLGLYCYQRVSFPQRLIPVITLLIAALPGHSSWVSVTVFIALLLYALYQIALARYRTGWQPAIRLLGGYALIAGSALLISLPFTLTLLRDGSTQAGIAFEIPHNLNSWPLLSPFSYWWSDNILAKLLDVLIHYLLEMGALLLAGLLGWWQFRHTNKDRAALYALLTLFLIVGFGLITFFASGRAYTNLGLTLNNDLSLRAIMPAQLALALFAGYYVAQLWNKKEWLMTIIIGLLILIGLASALWEIKAMGLAKYTQPPKIPTDVLAAFEAMPKITVPMSVVQHRHHDDFSRVQLDYGHRPNGYSTSEAISVGAVPPQKLGLAIEIAKQAFANKLPLRSYQLLRNLGADYVFVGPAEHTPKYTPDKFKTSFYFTPVYTAASVAIYQLNPVFTEKKLASFDQNILQWRGYFINPPPNYSAPTKSNKSPVLVTAWRLTQPADKNYTTFIHFVDPTGNIIAQADHQIWAWDIQQEGPTTAWTPELTHLDIVPLPPAVLTNNEPLSIRLGVWQPETGQQFPAEDVAMEIDQAGRLVIE